MELLAVGSTQTGESSQVVLVQDQDAGAFHRFVATITVDDGIQGGVVDLGDLKITCGRDNRAGSIEDTSQSVGSASTYHDFLGQFLTQGTGHTAQDYISIRSCRQFFNFFGNLVVCSDLGLGDIGITESGLSSLVFSTFCLVAAVSSRDFEGLAIGFAAVQRDHVNSVQQVGNL